MKEQFPNFYVFNPTSDYAVANGSQAWQPNKLLRKMELDLETLPLFFSKTKDYILVNKIPSPEFTTSLKQLNIAIPNFILAESIPDRNKTEPFKTGKLLPWGWSPEMHKRLLPLKSGCSSEFKKSPVYNWQANHRNLYSRKFAASVLETLITDYPDACFIEPRQTPKICTTQKAFEDLILRWGKLMVKAPWSSSGRGLQPITKTPVHPKVWERIMGIVNEQGYAVAEPYLEKALDMAFQFELKKGKIEYLGISNFNTDHKGQYIGNSLNGLPKELDEAILDFAGAIAGKVVGPLAKIIEASELAKYYEGFFGVDTLIYFNKKRELRINPCLEINVRQSMGLLSLQLEKLIHAEKKGVFRIFYKPGTNFKQFTKEMQSKHPLKIVNHKIESGFFPLIEARSTTLFGAYILVH